MNKPMTPYYVEPEDLSTTDRTRREDFTQRGIVHKPVYLAADVDVELTALRQQLAEAEKTMSGAWESMGNMSKRVEELKTELAEAQAEIDALMAIKVAHDQCLSSAPIQPSVLEEMNATLRQQLAEARSKLDAQH